MGKKKSLSGDLIDLTVATSMGGAAIQTVNASGLPAPLAHGTSSMIGVGLLKGASDIAKKKHRRLF